MGNSWFKHFHDTIIGESCQGMILSDRRNGYASVVVFFYILEQLCYQNSGDSITLKVAQSCRRLAMTRQRFVNCLETIRQQTGSLCYHIVDDQLQLTFANYSEIQRSGNKIKIKNKIKSKSKEEETSSKEEVSERSSKKVSEKKDSEVQSDFIEKKDVAEQEEKNVEELIFAWNSITKNVLPAVHLPISRKRRSAVRLRLKDEPDLGAWRRAFEIATRSDFLSGKNSRGWRATLDFFLRPDSLTKVLEGAYGGQTPEANPEFVAILQKVWGEEKIPESIKACVSTAAIYFKNNLEKFREWVNEVLSAKAIQDDDLGSEKVRRYVAAAFTREFGGRIQGVAE